MVTLRSTVATTNVVVVAELLPVLGSVVVVLTEAVLPIEVNRGVVGSTWTTSVNVADSPLSN